MKYLLEQWAQNAEGLVYFMGNIFLFVTFPVWVVPYIIFRSVGNK